MWLYSILKYLHTESFLTSFPEKILIVGTLKKKLLVFMDIVYSVTIRGIQQFCIRSTFSIFLIFF